MLSKTKLPGLLGYKAFLEQLSLKIELLGSWAIVPSALFELSKTELPGLLGYKAFLEQLSSEN